MQKIVLLGHFTPIGMRTKVTDTKALVVNSCSDNDLALAGDDTHWSWSNPTNRAITHPYYDLEAVSVECAWQGMKLLAGQDRPDPDIIAGNWRKNKGKRPIGAYDGPGRPLITNPGEARRKIYIPAYSRLISFWLQDEQVQKTLAKARTWDGPIMIRDHDVGRGIDRNGPLSHAWLLAMYLNDGKWPD